MPVDGGRRKGIVGDSGWRALLFRRRGIVSVWMKGIDGGFWRRVGAGLWLIQKFTNDDAISRRGGIVFRE